MVCWSGGDTFPPSSSKLKINASEGIAGGLSLWSDCGSEVPGRLRDFFRWQTLSGCCSVDPEWQVEFCGSHSALELSKAACDSCE